VSIADPVPTGGVSVIGPASSRLAANAHAAMATRIMNFFMVASLHPYSGSAIASSEARFAILITRFSIRRRGAGVMKIRQFIALVGGATVSFLTPPLLAAQEARTYRIGFLTGGPRGAAHHIVFFDELRMSGFIDGQNLADIAEYEIGSRHGCPKPLGARSRVQRVDAVRSHS
jgi:hypothetical protein